MRLLLEQLLLPPTSLILIIAAGLILTKRNLRMGLLLATASLILLSTLSLPFVTTRMLSSLEAHPALDRDDLAPLDMSAIVVLGATYSRKAPEYGGTSVDTLTLERARYGAYLQRFVMSPILVTGGSRPNSPTHTALELKRTLEEDFGARVLWSDENSRNTCDNARRSAEVLAPEGISSVLLVTHAWHMRRARKAFAGVGFQVIAAPTGFTAIAPLSVSSLIPSAKSLLQARFYFHEVLGGFLYRWTCRPVDG